jgi:hypothetical protein
MVRRGLNHKLSLTMTGFVAQEKTAPIARGRLESGKPPSDQYWVPSGH